MKKQTSEFEENIEEPLQTRQEQLDLGTQHSPSESPGWRDYLFNTLISFSGKSISAGIW